MQLKTKLVTVIVNCRNSEKYLRDCIDSVLCQTYSNLELIIVNNNSNDSTKEIIISYSDKRIKYFETEKTLSLGAARNYAINFSTGNYIAFLDSDDLWDKTKLEHVLKKFSKDIGLVYSDVLYFNSKKSFNLYSSRNLYKGNSFNNLLLDYNLCISSCVVSNELLKKNKIMFDEELNVCEDIDFFLKISFYSKIDYIKKILVKYRIHETNMSILNHELFYEEFVIIISNLRKKFKIDESILEKAKDLNTLNKGKFYWKKGKTISAYLELKKLNSSFSKQFIYSILFMIPYNFVNKIYRHVSPVKIEL